MCKKSIFNVASGVWWGLLFGCLLMVYGLCVLFTEGDGYVSWRGGYIYKWIGWVILPVSICIITYSIYALITGKGKPTTYTDEELAQAEAEMDAMYLREHGELPEKPEPEKPEPEKPKESTKSVVQEGVKKASAKYKW